jgi:hypothetical protein
VNAVMNIRFPQNAWKLSNGCITCGLSSSAHFKVSYNLFGCNVNLVLLHMHDELAVSPKREVA